ncbi:hypothetical protein AB4Y63_00480 [Leifsonia sp. YAF41]|uniref:hypothetical protein n=1 Tax=Leifsonia sp. YAF41 TaxID=3233086 RepID=UPI003F96402E
MTELTELTVPRKRNVKDLTVSIAALESGDQISATFFTERFGAFNLNGEARLSPAIGTFTIAGRAIEQSLKPDKALQTLAIVQSASGADDVGDVDSGVDDSGVDDSDVSDSGVDDAGAVDPELPVGDLSAVAELGHGDLVRAVFDDPAYGNFTVTGVAVFSRVGTMYLVGEWILGINQAPASRLRQIEIVAPAGSHPHPVPTTITKLADEVE